MAKNIRSLLKQIVRNHSVSIHRRGKVIRSFANKVGLVMFGNVDQHDDEFQPIRGLTVSTTHKDTHYAVGSFDDYDISLVDRFDLIIDPQGKEVEHNWLILEINLKSPETPPHVFLKPLGHSHASYDKFFTAFHHLQTVNTMLVTSHSPEFHARYAAYAASSHIGEIDTFLTTDITNTIATRFWPHAIEIIDRKLYVYTTELQLTTALLETVLQSAVWLAKAIDRDEEI